MKILHSRTFVCQSGLIKYKYNQITEHIGGASRCSLSHTTPCSSSNSMCKPMSKPMWTAREHTTGALSFKLNGPKSSNCTFLCNQYHWLSTSPSVCQKCVWKQGAQRRHCSSFSNSNRQGQQPWKVLFFGSNHFSLTCLRILDKNRHAGGLIEKLDVVVPQSKYIRRVGKKDSWVISPVLQYAQENGLTVHYWPLAEKVKGYDLGVVASFGRLIPGKVIRCFPHGILNVHPSLLPRWRGAAPTIHTILNNDAETGVSIMRIHPNRFDVGPILLQKAMSIPRDCMVETLDNILAQVGADMLLEVLGDLPNFIKNEMPQTEDGVSYGGKISSDHASVDWSKSVEHICRQYRAISSLIPLHTRWKGQHIVLRNMGDPTEISDLSNIQANASPGQVCYHKEADLLCIRCMDGWVGFQYITIALRQKLSAKDFYNGYLAHANSKTEHFS